MIIKKAILHIFGSTLTSVSFSQKELDITDYGTGEFIEKHLTKIVEDSATKEGEFLEYSVFKQSLERYVSGGSDFTEFSTGAGTLLYDQISQADEPESMDFLVCQFTDENDEYIGLLLLPNKTAYTHQVESGDDGVANKIIRYFYPAAEHQSEDFLLCNRQHEGLQGVSLRQEGEINGEAVEVLPDKVLQCTFQPSARRRCA